MQRCGLCAQAIAELELGASPASSAGCTTSAAQGGCGPYDKYPHITGITSSTGVGNNVWNTIPGWRQTLYVTDPATGT